MDPILVDTSVWIDFFKGMENIKTSIVREYLENDYPLFICPLIIQEILQGIRDDKEYEEVKNDLFELDILILDPVQSAIGAADLYRSIRKKGITIKKANDCMIAYYAIHYKMQLLHNDKDFILISNNCDLKIKA